MFWNSVAFAVGAFLLGYGADSLVRGAATIADKCRIPRYIAGLTLVALGTSAPELFLNLIAAARGETEIALANVSGSNMANVCVGFGLCALVGSVVIRRSDFSIDLVLLVVTPLFVLLAFFIDANRDLPYWSTFVLSGMLIYYFLTLRNRSGESDEELLAGNFVVGVGFFLLGVVLLYGGGRMVLDAAVDIAQRLGVGKDIIGLTIVAVGTSIPDITASVVATRQKEYGIATGNLLGSNISNILLVLNGTILVSRSSLAAMPFSRVDYAVVCLTSTVCLVAAMKSESISKIVGVSLLTLYFAYIFYRVWTVV